VAREELTIVGRRRAAVVAPRPVTDDIELF
jgi:hypothetical protein